MEPKTRRVNYQILRIEDLDIQPLPTGSGRVIVVMIRMMRLTNTHDDNNLKTEQRE